MNDFSGVLHVYVGNRFGGIETMLATMARSPLFAGQSYALLYPGRLYDEIRAAGADVEQIGGFRARKPWQALAVRKRLREVLAARRVHTIVTHMAIPHALVAPVAGARKIVYYAHEYHRGTHWSERWARLGRWPDLVIAGSAFDAESVPSIFPGLPTRVVYYAAELAARGSDEERAAVRRELATPLDHRVILSAARLTPYKGHEVLIEALGLLRERAGWTAWVAGAPQIPAEVELFARLKARVQALSLGERVRFLGERRDVPRLSSAADLACQANVGPEPFGLCFIEALAAGVPVVTSGIGGALEIVTPEVGELVPPGNARALAEGLARCMDSEQKAVAAQTLGPERARMLCSAAAFAERLGSAIDEARGSRPRV
ncbi:MAG TPA: glycosyltransferase [Polyangiaceae bacterium]